MAYMRNLEILRRKVMEGEQKIVIGDRVLRRQDLFQGEEAARRERAKLPFEEKIKILVHLQKLACGWGRRKNVIVWNTTLSSSGGSKTGQPGDKSS